MSEKKGMNVASITEFLRTLHLPEETLYETYNAFNSPGGHNQFIKSPKTPSTKKPVIRVNTAKYNRYQKTPKAPRPTNTLRSLNTTPYHGLPTLIPTKNSSKNYEGTIVSVNINPATKTKNTKNLFGRVGFLPPKKTRKALRKNRRRQSHKYRRH